MSKTLQKLKEIKILKKERRKKVIKNPMQILKSQ